MTLPNEHRRRRAAAAILALAAAGGTSGCAAGTTNSRDCKEANKTTWLVDPALGLAESSRCDDLKARERDAGRGQADASSNGAAAE